MESCAKAPYLKSIVKLNFYAETNRLLRTKENMTLSHTYIYIYIDI